MFKNLFKKKKNNIVVFAGPLPIIVRFDIFMAVVTECVPAESNIIPPPNVVR